MEKSARKALTAPYTMLLIPVLTGLQQVITWREKRKKVDTTGGVVHSGYSDRPERSVFANMGVHAYGSKIFKPNMAG